MKLILLLFLLLFAQISYSQEAAEEQIYSSANVELPDGDNIASVFFTVEGVMGWKKEGSRVIIFPIVSSGVTTAIIVKNDGETIYRTFKLGKPRRTNIREGTRTGSATAIYGITTDFDKRNSQSYYLGSDLLIKKDLFFKANLQAFQSSSKEFELQRYYFSLNKDPHTLAYGHISNTHVVPGFGGSILLGGEYFYRSNQGRFVQAFVGNERLQNSYLEAGLTYRQNFWKRYTLGYSFNYAQGTILKDQHYSNGLLFGASNIFNGLMYTFGVSNKEDMYNFYNSLTYVSSIKDRKYNFRQIVFNSLNSPQGSFGSYYTTLGQSNQFGVNVAFSNQLEQQILENQFERIDGALSTQLSYQNNQTDFTQRQFISVANQYNFSKINTRINGFTSWNTDYLPQSRIYNLSPEISVLFSGDRVKGWAVVNSNEYSLNKNEETYDQRRESNSLGLRRYYYNLSATAFVGQGVSTSDFVSTDSQSYGAGLTYVKNRYSISGNYSIQETDKTQTRKADLRFGMVRKGVNLVGRLNYGKNETSSLSANFISAQLNLSYSFDFGKFPLFSNKKENYTDLDATFFVDSNFNGVRDPGENSFSDKIFLDFGSSKEDYDLVVGSLKLKSLEDRPYFFKLPPGWFSASKYVVPGKPQNIAVFKGKQTKIQVFQGGELNNAYPLTATCSQGFKSSNFETEDSFLIFTHPADSTCSFAINLDEVTVPLVVKSSEIVQDVMKIEVERSNPVILGFIEGKAPKSKIQIESSSPNVEAGKFQHTLKYFKNGPIDMKLPSNCSVVGPFPVSYYQAASNYILRIRCN